MGVRLLWTMLVFGALPFAAACGGIDPATDPFNPSAGEVVIEVQNQNFLDATIYAIAPGVRRRLGTVTGKSDQRFRLDWDYSRPLQINIDLLAGGACRTRELLVNPGEVVLLVVEANLESDPDCRR